MKTKQQLKQNLKKDKDFYSMLEVKSERLVAALYMVSNFFSDSEPMKWKLRDMGLTVLSNVSLIKDKNSSERTALLSKTLSDAVTVISLLEIARLSDFISDMNYAILRREFNSFCSMIQSRNEVSESVGDFEFTDEFFNLMSGSVHESTPPKERQTHQHVYSQVGVSERKSAANKSNRTISYHPTGSTAAPVSPEVSPAPEVAKEIIKSPVHTPESGEDVSVSQNDTPIVQSPSPIIDEVSVKTSPKVEVPAQVSVPTPTQPQKREVAPRVVEKKNYRRNVIIDILRTKSDLSIKDISTIVTDCSEKTIQRELIAMVTEGVLNKEGERRWSRYSLADTPQ